MKKSYIIRLDDASTRMDVDKWKRMEMLLDKYRIMPLVGVIPDCKDPQMSAYPENLDFWSKVHSWIDKKWEIAMHGFEHLYHTEDGGINPINKRSEFAGVPFEEQCIKIARGYQILLSHNIEAKVFFAPSHTFDENTLHAIIKETKIRCISDTIAWDTYNKQDITFVPQQSGTVRNLPFRTTTFCYHPNTMDNQSFEELEEFFEKNSENFIQFNDALKNRRYSFFDYLLQRIYFIKRRFT